MEATLPINNITRLMSLEIFTLPTDEKNSSKSRGRILAASCIQKTVRASRSSGVSSGDGVLVHKQYFRYIMTSTRKSQLPLVIK